MTTTPEATQTSSEGDRRSQKDRLPTPSTELRWGVLGFARIFKKRMMPAFDQRTSAHRIEALCSIRHPSEARAFTHDHGIPRACETYEAILDDDSIQAVYIPLPNSLHLKWIVKAADRGKHVLCEKPLGYDRRKTADILEHCRAKQVVLMECHSYHLHPRHRALSRMLSEKTIGDIRQVQIHFSFPAGRQHAIRFEAGLGGGALLDLGCYGIDFMHRTMKQDPVSHWTRFDTTGDVDMEFTGAFKFRRQREFSIRVSLTQARQQTMIITGDKGSLFLPDAFIPSGPRATILVNNENGCTTHEFENSDQYALLLDEFWDSVQNRDISPDRYGRYLRNANLIEDLLNEREIS